MATDEEQYWEQEYADFEEGFCKGRVFWRVPVHKLQGTSLFSVFEQFCASFPDHPHEYNTVFYLFEATPQSFSVIFRCSHFEHSSLDDLRLLPQFLETAASVICTESRARVDLLDGCGEVLHICFYPLRDGVARLLQTRASRKVG